MQVKASAAFDGEVSSLDLLIICGCVSLVLCVYHIGWVIRKCYSEKVVEAARPFRNAGSGSRGGSRPGSVNRSPPRAHVNVVG